MTGGAQRRTDDEDGEDPMMKDLDDEKLEFVNMPGAEFQTFVQRLEASWVRHTGYKPSYTTSMQVQKPARRLPKEMYGLLKP